MNFFKRMLKGMVIGATVIIPGISGGTIAVILNIYDEMIEAISNIKKDFKGSFIFLFPIVIGIILSVSVLIFPFAWLFEHVAFFTILFFVGLIIGGIPPLFDKVRTKKVKKSNIFLSILTGLLVICLSVIPILGKFTYTVDFSNINVGGYFLLVLIGFVAATALTIPGISGSMLLLVLGYYYPILGAIKSLIKFENFGQSFLILLSFGIGILIAIFIISKIMDWLLKNKLIPTYYAIIGFVIGSVFAILCTDEMISEYAKITWWWYPIGIILMVLGIIGSTLLVKMGKKYVKNSEEIQ